MGPSMTYSWWDVLGCVVVYSALFLVVGLVIGIAIGGRDRP